MFSGYSGIKLEINNKWMIFGKSLTYLEIKEQISKQFIGQRGSLKNIRKYIKVKKKYNITNFMGCTKEVFRNLCH